MSKKNKPSVLQRHLTASYSGPIPPPMLLKQYNDVIPNAAERILSLAERQSHHRMELENTVVKSDIHRSWAGIVVGGALCATCIIGGVWLVYQGHDWAGTGIATSSVIGLAGVFVYGTAIRRKEREEKAKTLTRK